MKHWESTGMEIYFSKEGSDRLEKQVIHSVTQEPQETDVLAFGHALAQLSPSENHYSSTVVVTKERVIA